MHVIFFDNLSILRDAEVADSPISGDPYLVAELVDKVVCVAYTMPTVVWVEGLWETKGIVAANDLKLVHDLDFEYGCLSGE